MKKYICVTKGTTGHLSFRVVFNQVVKMIRHLHVLWIWFVFTTV